MCFYFYEVSKNKTKMSFMVLEIWLFGLENIFREVLEISLKEFVWTHSKSPGHLICWEGKTMQSFLIWEALPLNDPAILCLSSTKFIFP